MNMTPRLADIYGRLTCHCSNRNRPRPDKNEMTNYREQPMIPLPGVQETELRPHTFTSSGSYRAQPATEFLSVWRRGVGDRPQFGINPRLSFLSGGVFSLPPQLPSCSPHAVAAVRREWIPRYGRVKMEKRPPEMQPFFETAMLR